MTIRYAVLLSILAISVFFSAYPGSAETPEPFTGEINADSINIRADATVSAEIICKAGKGERVDVVRELYDWYKIRLPEQATSFIKKDFVSVTEPGKGIVTAVNVNVRLFPAMTAFVVGKADKDEQVVVLGESDGWYKIRPVANSFGWVNKKFVQKISGAGSVVQVAGDQALREPSLSASALKPGQFGVAAVIPAIPENAKALVSAVSNTFEGLVKTYGHVIRRIATHKLITKDKQVYLLRYDKKELNKFILHNVRITGKLITPQKQKFPLIEVEKIEALD